MYKTLKLAVLSQVEAKGSTWNMLISLSLCLRWHCQFIMLTVLLQDTVCWGLNKNKGDCHQCQIISLLKISVFETICSVVDTFNSLVRIVLLQMCAVDLVIHLTNNKPQLYSCAAGSPVLHCAPILSKLWYQFIWRHFSLILSCGNETDCSSSVVINET
jgi:hypothetical protein